MNQPESARSATRLIEEVIAAAREIPGMTIKAGARLHPPRLVAALAALDSAPSQSRPMDAEPIIKLLSDIENNAAIGEPDWDNISRRIKEVMLALRLAKGVTVTEASVVSTSGEFPVPCSECEDTKPPRPCGAANCPFPAPSSTRALEAPLAWAVFVEDDPLGYDYFVYPDEEKANKVAAEHKTREVVPLYRLPSAIRPSQDDINEHGVHVAEVLARRKDG